MYKIKDKDKKRINKKKKIIRLSKEVKPTDMKRILRSDTFDRFYIKPKFYIFQIGFNRCATESIHKTFLKIGIKSLHYGWSPSKLCSEQKLALVMYDNLCNPQINYNILNGPLSKCQAFTDMEYTYEDNYFCFYKFFKDIEKQYPGSKFIMNIRDCEDWLRSRLKLGIKKNNGIYEAIYYYKNVSPEKIKNWVDLFFIHCVNVRDYFKIPLISNRSKLYILPINEKSITELFREMGIYNGTKDIHEDTNTMKRELTNEQKAMITDEIREYINEKKKKYGDPSKLNWWN